MFFKKSGPEKLVRFRRPEFQEKLARARRFTRKSEPVSASAGARVLSRFGIHSRFARGFLVFLVIAVIYFLTVSRIFLVKKVLTESQDPSAEELHNVLKRASRRRTYLIPMSHILLFDKSRAQMEFQQAFPQVKRIELYKRIFPDTIEVSFVVRKPQYVWTDGQNYFFLDQDGIIFETIGTYDKAAYPQFLIRDESGTAVSIGQNLAIQDILAFIERLQEAWPKHVYTMSVSDLALPGLASGDLKVGTSAGFMIYFDAERDAEIQLKNLAYLLNSEIKPEILGGLSYIDLRLPNIGYYCFKDAPCALENATSTKL